MRGSWQRALIWNGADATDLPLLGLGRYERLLLNLGRYGITEVAWAHPAPDIEARLASSPLVDRLPARTEWNASAAPLDDRPLLVVHGDALFDLLILPWFAHQLGAGLEGVLGTSDDAQRPAMVSVRSAATLVDCVDFETVARRAAGVRVTPPRGSVCLRVPTGARPRPLQRLWPTGRKPVERWTLRGARRWTFPVAAALASRRVDPNTISWVSFWIGVAGAVLLAFGGYGERIAGAALLYGQLGHRLPGRRSLAAHLPGKRRGRAGRHRARPHGVRADCGCARMGGVRRARRVAAGAPRDRRHDRGRASSRPSRLEKRMPSQPTRRGARGGASTSRSTTSSTATT